MFAELILVSTISWQVTSYRSVPEQTKPDDPFHTSIGMHVQEGLCAVSQDQLGKTIHYGDMLFIEIPAKPELSRFCFVADTMNARHKRAIDIWVRTKAEEHAVNVRRGYVYKLSGRHLISTSTTNSLSKPIEAFNSLKAFKELQNVNVNDQVEVSNSKTLKSLFKSFKSINGDL